MLKKYTIYNLMLSVSSNILVLIMGLIVPRVILTHYGSDINGFMSTITQIYGYLSLLEAGISQATLNSLYKPLKDGDRNSVSMVLAASRRYYRKITKYYFLGVVGLSFCLPFVIKSNLDYITIFWAVLLEGASNVILFYFIQTPSILLIADGKNYIKVLFEFIINFGRYFVKIFLALLSVNIIYIQLCFFLLSMLKLLIYRIYMDKHYKWIDYKECKQILLPDRKAYVITEVAWTLFSSTDIIVLSIFCSTKLSSVYSINNMPFIAINGVINAAYNGTYYLLGKKYVEGTENYKKIHDTFNSCFMTAVTSLMCVTVLLSQPFIKLYTQGINDVDYTYFWLPVFLGAIQILSWSRYVSGNLSGIAGYAKRVSVISLVEAATNVILSLILVQKWEIYGVVIATVLALPLKVIYTNYLADKIILKRSIGKTVKIICSNYIIYILTIYIRTKVNFDIDSISDFIKYGVCLSIIFIGICTIVNVILNKDLLEVCFSKNKDRRV